MIFKFRYEKLGGHFHVAVFSAEDQNKTFAKLGDLVLAEKDMASLEDEDYEFIFEEKKNG